MFIVTGGAGFIGSVLINELEKTFKGKSIAVIDWLGTDDRWKNLNSHTISDIIFPEGALDYLEDHAHEITAIIHMGAISTTTECDADLIVERNIGSTLDLFDWCTENDTPFIYASSAATYGEGEQGFDDNTDMDHLTKLLPLNAYGFSKSMVDKAIISKPNKPSQWVGLKFFNVYGPNEYHKGGQKSVVAHAFKQINETNAMNLFKSYNDDFKDGEQLRDFVYVKDIARAICWFIQNRNVSGIFNQGTGEARSFKDLVNAVFSAMNKDEDIKYIEMPANIKDQYQYYTKANMTKFQKVYGENSNGDTFKFTSLEEGVADYVQNHLMQANPYL